MIRWLALLAVFLTSSTFALDEAELAEFLEAERIEMKMPGLRAAVRYAGGRLVRAAVGLGNVEAGTPLDNDVGMPGGSTGKTFVAALTMQLVEDGHLALDDPVSKWLGEHDWYRRLPNADTMQVGHLLSHSSGLGDYPGTPRFLLSMTGRVLRHGSASYTPEELIRFGKRRKAYFPAGEGYRYSDVGYLVLGRVIEAATGDTYYDLLQERILDPLNLDQARPQDQSVLTGIVPGYTGGASTLRKDGRMKLDPSSEWTGGGLVTTPTMLVEFYAALAEGRVVSEASLEKMLNAGWREPESSGFYYGFGMFVADDRSWFSHGGLWSGYRTHVAHVLDSGTTLAVQTNRDGRVDLVGLIRRLDEVAHRR